MRVALIPMRVEVGNFETNWREFEKRFKEALAYSRTSSSSQSTVSPASRSGISPGRGFTMR